MLRQLVCQCESGPHRRVTCRRSEQCRPRQPAFAFGPRYRPRSHGVSHQLYRGCPPRSVMAARSGAIRMIACGLRFVGPILGSGGFQPIRYARSGGIARLAQARVYVRPASQRVRDPLAALDPASADRAGGAPGANLATVAPVEEPGLSCSSRDRQCWSGQCLVRVGPGSPRRPSPRRRPSSIPSRRRARRRRAGRGQTQPPCRPP